MSKWPPLLAPARRKYFATVVLCGLGQALAAGGIALLIRHTFDSLLRASDTPSLSDASAAGAGFLIAGIAIYVFRVIERGAAEALAQNYIAQLRQKIFSRVLNADGTAFRSKRRGHLMVRFVGDLGAVRSWIADGVSQITVAVIVIPVVAGVLLTINAKIISVVILLLAISFLTIFVMRQSLRSRHAFARLNRGKMAGELGEKLTNAPAIDAFGQTQRERRRLKRRSLDVIHASVARRRYSAMATGIPDVAASGAMAVIIVMGVVEISRGSATPGDIIAILTTLSLIVTPLKELASVFDRWRNFSVAKEKIGNLLSIRQIKTAPQRGLKLRPGSGQLTFRNVKLDGIVENFSAEVTAGTLIQITGPNGVGKSALLRAAAGLADLDNGKIFIDGSNYRKARRSDLRKAISVFSKDLPLFRGTIRRNISYRDPNTAESEIQRLISMCDLEDLIDRMPGGVDARIAEGGVDLSPGQQTRLQLARTLVGSPRLIILDEPDRHLDERGLNSLIRVLSERQFTVLLATNSTRCQRLVDEVWEMNGHSIEINRPTVTSSQEATIHQLRTAKQES